jgi:Mn-containing catalase
MDRAPDPGTKKVLHYLLTREIAHTKMFMKALESLGKLTEPAFGNVKPDETVNIYYHLSTNGAPQRGPWNQEPEFKYIADPLKQIEHGELVGAGGKHIA